MLPVTYNYVPGMTLHRLLQRVLPVTIKRKHFVRRQQPGWLGNTLHHLYTIYHQPYPAGHPASALHQPAICDSPPWCRHSNRLLTHVTEHIPINKQCPGHPEVYFLNRSRSFHSCNSPGGYCGALLVFSVASSNTFYPTNTSR